MKLSIAGALAGALLCVSSSCMTFELEGDGIKSPDSCHGGETIHGSMYGFQWTDHVIEKCTDQHGLYRVEFHTNGLLLLVSALTLGLYVPQTVEWWCDAGRDWGDDGELFDPDEPLFDPSVEEVDADETDGDEDDQDD